MRRDLRAILGDASCASVMVGLGETYLPAFVLALGMGEVLAGLIVTIPMLTGSILQLAAPWACQRLGSHRRWVAACALLQATVFLPLVAAAVLGRIPTVAVFLAASIYWAAGLATLGPWNTWVDAIVPGSVRASYFARRTRFTQAGTLVGFVGGGLALQAGAAWGQPLSAFACLFLVAAACRYASAFFLISQSEPVPPSSDQRLVSWRELAGRFRGHDGSLMLYLLAVQTAVQISGPYFTPFILKHVQLSYVGYVALIGASFVGKILALPALGKFARRCGARRLLWLGGVGIVPVAGLWLFSRSFGWLLIIQLIGGASWAAYELAMFLMFFESIPTHERTSVLTTYNFGNALAAVIGSLAGGCVLSLLGEQASTYLAIFAISSVARLATVALLARVPARAAVGATHGSLAQDGAVHAYEFAPCEVGDPDEATTPLPLDTRDPLPSELEPRVPRFAPSQVAAGGQD